MTPLALLPAAACLAAAVAATQWLPMGTGRPLAMRTAGWLGALAAVLVTYATTPGLHPVGRMVALIAVALAWMKALVLAEHRLQTGGRLTGLAWLAFTLGWVGMNPRAFERRAPRRRAASRLLRFAVPGILVGGALLLAARWIWLETGLRWLTAAAALPGISLVLHFGVLNLLAALWAAVGYRTDRLFLAPLRSTSLTEFWGRRWNLAFRDMTALVIYRPIARAGSSGAGLVTAFLVSGLLHEMAISAPVDAGWGLPTAYFAIHAVAAAIERAAGGSGRFRGWAGRAWTAVFLVAPLPLLFHGPFLAGVVWPLLGL